MFSLTVVARWAGHALALVAIGLCLLLPTSRYDWVGDVDPAIRPGDFAGGGNDAAVVVGAFAVAALLVEAIALATGRGRAARIVPALLIVAVAGAWLVRVMG